ncbi:hypothetical protein D1Y84_12695 [Acidipila sp. EB88]|nr:hypothetical protein D1Y84_12695 [Acidipila sp. EB88]
MTSTLHAAGWLLHGLNSVAGLFAVVIAFSAASCAKSLASINKHVECMHEDYELVHHAHDVADQNRESDIVL